MIFYEIEIINIGEGGTERQKNMTFNLIYSSNNLNLLD